MIARVIERVVADAQADPEAAGADALLVRLVSGLREHYGTHIVEDPHWIFSMVGGATGVMAVLHASIGEYLVVFGTPLGTEGYSGRYSVHIHDWVLRGEMWTLRIDDPMRKHVTAAGECRELPRGLTTAFRLIEDTWLVEYGRGNAATSLRHSIGDAIFRAMDAHNIIETLREYGTLAAHELFRPKDE